MSADFTPLAPAAFKTELDKLSAAVESSSWAHVAYAGNNSAARPSAETVYWKGWPSHLTPTNSLPGDLIFSPST
jgi:hypothetical protein